MGQVEAGGAKHIRVRTFLSVNTSDMIHMSTYDHCFIQRILYNPVSAPGAARKSAHVSEAVENAGVDESPESPAEAHHRAEAAARADHSDRRHLMMRVREGEQHAMDWGRAKSTAQAGAACGRLKIHMQMNLVLVARRVVAHELVERFEDPPTARRQIQLLLVAQAQGAADRRPLPVRTESNGMKRRRTRGPITRCSSK